MQFTKIENPVYTVIEEYAMLDSSNQIQIKYSLGVGDVVDGQLTNWRTIISDYKYITGEEMEAIKNAPITSDDVGKSSDDIIRSRIYNHLKEKGLILI